MEAALEAGVEVIQFKRTGRKPQAKLRKRQNEGQSKPDEQEGAVVDEEEEEEEPLGLMLRETRKLQRERERIKGCEAAATSAEVLQKIANASVIRPVVSEEGDKETHLLQSTFTVEAEQDVVNPLLENYIEERLRKFREERAKEATEKAKVEQKQQNLGTEDIEEPKEKEFDLQEEERRLYETPDHLKVSKSTRSDDQVSEAWLTGIQEIELPIEFKLKNIEATEEAKRSLMKRKPDTNPPPQQDTYNTRFGRPSSVTQIVRRDRNNDRESRDNHHHHHHDGERRERKKDHATDDITLERFKKRFRR